MPGIVNRVGPSRLEQVFRYEYCSMDISRKVDEANLFRLSSLYIDCNFFYFLFFCALGDRVLCDGEDVGWW